MLKNNEMLSFMIILQEALSWGVKFALNPIDLVHPIFVSRSKGIQDLSCTSAAQDKSCTPHALKAQDKSCTPHALKAQDKSCTPEPKMNEGEK
jgi:hypothetical protein